LFLRILILYDLSYEKKMVRIYANEVAVAEAGRRLGDFATLRCVSVSVSVKSK